MDAQLLAAAKNLKVVGRAGNGIDNIDLDAATAAGVVVVNTPESNSVSAAEHTIGLMLASCRNTCSANRHIKSGKWDRSPFKGNELHGKTVGIIGLGRIGGLVATRLLAFNMRVIAMTLIFRTKGLKYYAQKAEKLEDLSGGRHYYTHPGLKKPWACWAKGKLPL